MFTISVLLIMWLATPFRTAVGHMEIVYQWSDVDYTFPNQSFRNKMVNSGAYILGNAVPLDVDVAYLDSQIRVFVTLPPFLPGVPASLATVVNSNRGQPLLQPYPDWDWYRQGDCDAITSVVRIQIDQCGQLWVLDSGVVDIFSNNSRLLCQPQLLVFDVRTDQLLWRYRIPENNFRIPTLLGTVAVDLRGSCKDAYVYMADIRGYSLVVLDALRARSWRVPSNYFYPYPLAGHFNLNGVQFDLMDGVISLALSNNNLYFHSLASRVESLVPTAVLDRETNFQNGNTAFEKFSVSQGERSGQSGPSAVDGSGTALFFSILPENSLNCWNTQLPYRAQNIEQLYQDNVTFQFASGLKVIRDQDGMEWVWALTSRLQNLIVGKVDRGSINYRILRGPVRKLVQGTSCASLNYN